MSKLKINGNDLEFSGHKVARLFDVDQTIKSELESIINQANSSKESMRFQRAYRDGWQDGYEQGFREGKDTL